MKYYFRLQKLRFDRLLTELGVIPILGYLLILVIFIALSNLLFHKTPFAPYIYPAICLIYLVPLGEKERALYIKTLFHSQDYLKIRIAENLAISIGFIIILLFHYQLGVATALAIASMLLILLPARSIINHSIPTPFYKIPFEFVMGFRQYLPGILFAYFLCYMALSVGNFNLGIFSLLVIMALVLHFYSHIENVYFVWIYSLSSHYFIFHKIKTALAYSIILVSPILIAMTFSFSHQFYILLTLTVISLLNIVHFILIKYSRFPAIIHLPQSLVFIACLLFTPLLFISIPYYYRRAHQNISPIIT